MQPQQDLLQKGIAAFQAGEREKARALLEQYVDIEPDDEQGWYYLAAVDSDPQIRKRHLERVLEINPTNAKAREVLDRIKAREATVLGDAPTSSTSASGDGTASTKGKPRLRVIDPEAAPRAGAADSPENGFKLPIRIPGAPDYISLQSVARDGIGMLRTGWQILLRRPGTYGSEVDMATWWRFWLVVLTGAILSAAVSLVFALYIVIVSSVSLFSFFSILLTPLLSVPLTVIALFAGCVASYQYAKAQKWNAPLVKHCMTAGIVWAPMVVFTSVLTFILSLFGFGGGLTAVFMMVLAGYIMGDGYERLYLVTEPKDKFAIPAIALIVMLVVTVIFRALFGGVIVGGALPFTLF